MRTPRDSKLKPASMLVGVLLMVAIVAIVPPVFAQQSNPLQYTDSNNPAGPLQPMGWAVGLATAGVLSGVGVWTAIRRR